MEDKNKVHIATEGTLFDSLSYIIKFLTCHFPFVGQTSFLRGARLTSSYELLLKSDEQGYFFEIEHLILDLY